MFVAVLPCVPLPQPLCENWTVATTVGCRVQTPLAELDEGNHTRLVTQATIQSHERLTEDANRIWAWVNRLETESLGSDGGVSGYGK